MMSRPNIILADGLNSSSTSTPVIEPSEPSDLWLSSFPQDLAFEEMASRYIALATWAVFTWEILINIDNDYNLLFERRISYPTVVYFISRLCGFGCAVTALVGRYLPTVSTSVCVMSERLTAFLFSATVIFTSLLFFFRTRAVFNTYPWAIAFFVGLLLAVLGGYLAFLVNIFEPISGNPLFCVKPGINKLVAVITIIPLINDSLVFLAISWRLSLNSYDLYSPEGGVRFLDLIVGKYLPAFSKAIFLDGQAYYLVVVTMNIISVTTMFHQSTPYVFRTVFTVPNIILTNVMATRVFRNTMLLSNNIAEIELSTIHFHDSEI